MAALVLKNIRKVYSGEAAAVENFSLEVADGEFCVIVGPSGCGKSTLLRMIAGLEEITEGTLILGGQTANDLPPQRRNIAMVFQNYALYPHMSVFQNMAFGLKMRKTPKEELQRRVESTAARLGISELLGRRPSELSGGERQRVALGRAVVREAAVFLLDEPLSNLDAQLRTAMRRELVQLQRSLGLTFVYVTHDQTEAMTMADRIVVMQAGRIQQIAPPEALYRCPANLFVAGFIGSPPINLFSATIKQDAAGLFAEAAFFRLRLPAEAATSAECRMGPEVLVGIRPEDIALAEPKSAGAVEARVLFTERLGAEQHVHAAVGEEHLIIRTPPGPEREGDTLRLVFPPGALHLFDKESGRRLF